MKLMLLTLLLLPTLAFAQTDQLVFFTGTSAAPDLTPHRFTTTSFESVQIQLGILNPSLDCISGFEADFWYEGSPLAPAWDIPACGLIPECTMAPFEIGMIECLPFGPDLVFPLGSFSMLVPGPTDVVRLYIGPVPGSAIFPDSPGYTKDLPMILAPLTTIQGVHWDRPVYTINAVTVGDEDESWSGIKTLYR